MAQCNRKTENDVGVVLKLYKNQLFSSVEAISGLTPGYRALCRGNLFSTWFVAVKQIKQNKVQVLHTVSGGYQGFIKP